ncbi:glycosyltransferase family 2 protein [Teredinibacter haidensis]|uniref:glycosyltransferase family 2 protein n=1 Tax=Teredinibacter haidensis TaxID=2731755 RepID=UPI000948C4B7|nr:glycosyltransferase family 2 protein [Teredinibacter haidensis]
MKISVIFTTYNSPEWLEKVLWGFHYQTDDNFEVVIADDGSDDKTRDLIELFKSESHRQIQHIWHPDQGFQKCQILNKAIQASEGDYIVMTDGDCIPRRDFIAAHREAAEPGMFLSGGYFKLPMVASKAITRENVKNGDCFNPDWLVEYGVKRSIKFMKLTTSKLRANIYNLLTATKRSWNGHNASCWKKDAVLVNGFDERMKYGGLDCEFGGRLLNAGIRGKQIRYSAICVHLDHARGYANEEDWKRNRIIRKTSIREKLIETPAGISQAQKS